jgi:predicted ATPase
MADAAELRARLRRVYWIGGGSGAGKSTIARRLPPGPGVIADAALRERG